MTFGQGSVPPESNSVKQRQRLQFLLIISLAIGAGILSVLGLMIISRTVHAPGSNPTEQSDVLVTVPPTSTVDFRQGDNWATYRSEEDGFSFEYPVAWRLETTKSQIDPEGRFRIRNPQWSENCFNEYTYNVKTICTSNIRITLHHNSSRLIIDDFRRTRFKVLETINQPDGFQQLEIDGRTAYYFGEPGSHDTLIYPAYWVVMENGDFLVIQDAGLIEAYEPIFHRLVMSIKFDPSVKLSEPRGVSVSSYESCPFEQGLFVLWREPFDSAASWSGNRVQLVVGVDPKSPTNRVMSMQGGQTASFFKDIRWPEDTLLAGFDYMFQDKVGSGDANLTVYLTDKTASGAEDKIVYWDSAIGLARGSLTPSGAFYVGEVAGRLGRLSFVLRPTTTAANSVPDNSWLIVDNIVACGLPEEASGI